MRILLLLLFVPLSLFAQKPSFSKEEIARWKKQAKQVTIIRDNWGIPHIYGKTDADVVFGLLYAQCEDDFRRMEYNYLDILGRTAEVRGENSLYYDLYTRLLVDSAGALQDYKNSPAWLKKLLNAFADGMNYYLYKHPAVKPALLTRFEPWYPLMWTDGSINAIQTGGVSVSDVRSFYAGNNSTVYTAPQKQEEDIHNGSNGFAIAPKLSASGNALLYINPHVTFYFRPEVHVVSEEGLNSYGAITWGQFFVYQGFNEHCGWMHTSGYADVADVYAEKVEKKGNGFIYHYNKEERKVTDKTYTLRYRDGNAIKTKSIKVFYTHHGPVMAKRNGQWLTVKAKNRSLDALIQSYQRTKTTGFASFKKNMELLSNSSNNTVYADDEGNIAYWHGNFIPRRDTSFNWSEPVDGSITATEWNGLHQLEETIHLYNPASGWIQNCNSTPYTAAGESSPQRKDYPFYMATEPDNFRGITAARIVGAQKDYTIDKLISTGYNTYLSFFEKMVPNFVKGFENSISKDDPLYTSLYEPVQTLKNWDLHARENSVATTLAIEWAEAIRYLINRVRVNGEEVDFTTRVQVYAEKAPVKEMAGELLKVVNELKEKFNTWQVPWGEINRYQRLTGNLQQTYDDNKPSLPVGFAASTYGCIPSFVSRPFNGTKKRYGYNGNSFICAVEFPRKDKTGEKKLKAKSLLTGGETSDPSSKHFDDQALMYTKGQFKDVLFYKEDVLKHAEKTYHPGEE